MGLQRYLEVGTRSFTRKIVCQCATKISSGLKKAKGGVGGEEKRVRRDGDEEKKQRNQAAV